MGVKDNKAKTGAERKDNKAKNVSGKRTGGRRVAIIITAVAALLAATAGVVFTLTRNKPLDLKANISYCDKYVYAGKSANFSVTVRVGIAEKTFIADGKAVDVVDFCKITLSVLNISYSKEPSFSYRLIMQDGSYIAGTISRDPITLEFTGSVSVANPADIKSFLIEYGSSRKDSIALNSLLVERLTCEAAYEAALKVFESEIKESTKNGYFNREIYIKFVTGYNGEEPYYWYVAFIASDCEYWAVLLDSKTGAPEVRRTYSTNA